MPGAHTTRSTEIYQLSPYRVSPRLVRSVATVKHAAALTNHELGYLSAEEADSLVAACHALSTAEDAQIESWIPLDAYQGGAGTSINMAVNEWLAAEAGLDALAHANLHQSTNDVMPTALRLMMLQGLRSIESGCEQLQTVLQAGEQTYEHIVKIARTQLRDAVVTTLGREYGTWAHAIARDRWRAFKARERIRELNIGGTAIGTGAGAPRSYVLGVSRVLQRLVEDPVTRAEHLVEATSNYDGVVEAMEAPRSIALNLRRIANDLRLLSSGPATAIGELALPAIIPGSSIMPQKTNPVIPEAIIQVAERVMANDSFLTRLAAMSELELNAFFPAIAHTVDESLEMVRAALGSLASYVEQLVPDEARIAKNLREGYGEAVALLAVLSYDEIERLIRSARARGESIGEYMAANGLATNAEIEALFHPRNLTGLGYDETLIGDIREAILPALRLHIRTVEV